MKTVKAEDMTVREAVLITNTMGMLSVINEVEEKLQQLKSYINDTGLMEEKHREIGIGFYNRE